MDKDDTRENARAYIERISEQESEKVYFGTVGGGRMYVDRSLRLYGRVEVLGRVKRCMSSGEGGRVYVERSLRLYGRLGVIRGLANVHDVDGLGDGCAVGLGWGSVERDEAQGDNGDSNSR